mmetsp:Transcript_17926/g.18117  ORF Transcript_17926/g.18117 Transcript_17926/m.18117 type:complete len:262 (+) Transcript_17926:120-905(+)
MKISNDMTETETATETATTEEDQKEMPYYEDPDWERRSQTAVPTDYFTNNEWDTNDDESWEYVRQETFSPTEWATATLFSDDTAHTNIYWGDDDAGSEDDDFTAKAWEDDAVSWSSSEEDDQVIQEQLQELQELVIAADSTITTVEPEDEPNCKVEPEQFVMGSSNNNSNLIVEKNNKKNGIGKGGKIATGIIGGVILLLGLVVLVIYFFGEKLFGKYLYDSESEESDGIIKDHDTLEFSSDQHSKEDDIVDGVDEYLQTV